MREDDGCNIGRDYLMQEPKASTLGSQSSSEHTKKSCKAYLRVVLSVTTFRHLNSRRAK